MTRSAWKIDPGGQAHRRDHDVELASLGERLNQTGSHRVAQTAVMIRHPTAQQFRQAFSGERFLFRRERERIARRQGAGDCLRQLLGRVAARREDQDRREPGMQCPGNHPRPKFAHLQKSDLWKIVQIDFMLRHRAFVMPDEHRITSVAPQPFDHVLGIIDAPAEE